MADLFAISPMISSMALNWSEMSPLVWLGLKSAQVLGFVLVLALLVAALVLADRKIWAAVQMRRGPNVVGAFGLLQTIADALKFFFKEIVVPAGSDKFLFILAPVLTLVMAFLAWAVIPVALHGRASFNSANGLL